MRKAGGGTGSVLGGQERSPHLLDCGGTASPKKWQRDRDSGSRRSTLSSRCEGRWEQLLPEKGAWEGPVEGAKPAGGPALTSTHVKPNLGPRSRKRRECKLKMKGAFRDPPPGPPCGTDLCAMAARSPPATPEAIDVLNFMPTVTLFFFSVSTRVCTPRARGARAGRP